MNVRCPNCLTLYRITPERVPAIDTRARCGRCAEVFPIASNTITAPAEAMAPPAEARVAPAVPEVGPARVEAAPAHVEVPPARGETVSAPTTGVQFFGPQDPHQRARNLARALVSDIVAYYPDRIERSRAAGTLRDEFREEILKSWEEFVLQVGSEFARETDHFQVALNEILASGAQVF